MGASTPEPPLLSTTCSTMVHLSEALNETQLIALAAALGAESVPRLSSAEAGLLGCIEPQLDFGVRDLREVIHAGGDPLGEGFSRIRSASDRKVDDGLGRGARRAATLEILADPDLREAFRYLAGPPI